MLGNRRKKVPSFVSHIPREAFVCTEANYNPDTKRNCLLCCFSRKGDAYFLEYFFHRLKGGALQVLLRHVDKCFGAYSRATFLRSFVYCAKASNDDT